MKTKLAPFILLSIFSSLVSAECTPEQNREEIPLSVETESDASSGGNHGAMDRVIIKAPLEVSGVPLASMKLTEGEVASFWVPLAYQVAGDFVRAEIIGYRSAIESFEVAVYYESENCSRSIQRLLFW
ncbi:MAG: hypothetical protein ACQES2_07785 [Pseudomonadota bacterium]